MYVNEIVIKVETKECVLMWIFIYVFNILFVPPVSVIQQMLIFNMSNLGNKQSSDHACVLESQQ